MYIVWGITIAMCLDLANEAYIKLLPLFKEQKQQAKDHDYILKKIYRSRTQDELNECVLLIDDRIRNLSLASNLHEKVAIRSELLWIPSFENCN